YFHTWVSWTPQVGHGWACTSTNPGTIVFPATSMIWAPGGACPRGPTETIRSFVTTTSPFSMISSPFIDTTRAPRNTTVPRGMSRGTRIATSTRAASYAGSLPRESERALRRFCTESGSAFTLSLLSESARSESTRALLLSAESATAGSNRKKLRPIDQYAWRPSAVQPVKSPPIIVRRRAGNAADDGSDTLIVGVWPPTWGSVTT